jgi:hypothetical protein
MSDLPSALKLALLLHDRELHGIAPSTFSSTYFLAFLLLPLNDFALSHFHAPLPHASVIFLQNKSLAAPPPPHACPLHVV